MKPQAGILYSALAFYAAWTAATWYFEGRIETLLRPEATGDRIIYAFAVNLLFGIAGGIALLRHWKRRGTLDTARAGFGSVKRVAAAMGAGLCLGLAAYVLQGAPSMNPVVIVNAFAQVLVVSAAEVLVCWALVGAAAEALLQRHGRVVPAVLASLLASILFGVYHYAHSAPFNTLQMVLLLTAVGLVTSAFFFASRDLAGTIAVPQLPRHVRRRPGTLGGQRPVLARTVTSPAPLHGGDDGLLPAGRLRDSATHGISHLAQARRVRQCPCRWWMSGKCRWLWAIGAWACGWVWGSHPSQVNS